MHINWKIIFILFLKNHNYLLMGYVYLLGMSLFLQPWNWVGHHHLHVLFHADLPWYLLSITVTTEIPALWSYDIIERRVAQSNVETMNYFELVCDRLQELPYFPQANENIPRQIEFLVVLWALWHPVWELKIQTLQILRRPYLVDEGFANCSWLTLQPTSLSPAAAQLYCTHTGPFAISWPLCLHPHPRAFAFALASTWNPLFSRGFHGFPPQLIQVSAVPCPPRTPSSTLLISRGLTVTGLPFCQSPGTFGGDCSKQTSLKINYI